MLEALCRPKEPSQAPCLLPWGPAEPLTCIPRNSGSSDTWPSLSVWLVRLGRGNQRPLERMCSESQTILTVRDCSEQNPHLQVVFTSSTHTAWAPCRYKCSGFPGQQPRPSEKPKKHHVLPSKGLSGGSGSKESACSAGDLGSIPGSGRSPGGGNGNPLQCSCLENPMDRGVRQRYSPWGHRESDLTERLAQTLGL